jgi:transposase-like protein
MQGIKTQVEEPKCPQCSSDNVSKSRKPKSVVGLLLLFFGIPLPIFKDEYYCFDCRNEFKMEKEP